MTNELRDVLTEALREAHYRILGSSSDARVDPGQVLADVVLGLPGVAVIQLPEPAEVDVDDEERPKRAGDFLKRDDTRSEVWIEGLPGQEPYVFFGRRGMGPSYFPAEFASDVAAALLAAAAAAAVAEGEDNHG
ncbi:hypothetical protein SEA_FANCYPANTS_92 [Mycobacterium phage Fancypants]|uniref:Uncharacterized protein n=1 Tax=Mycobacterium phage Fancypants TaxID=2530128 RepID=A0A481VUR3_9CAUD|nr:hypothetical protein I5H36_gp092 [Mycobacterium phage Fancypants]QBI97428.1 hypothetical protein SEA_FANCYPANTS_92 [Mycobacterium phage Fancypants]